MILRAKSLGIFDFKTKNQGNFVIYGIKLCDKNIGFNGQFYTFPYFLTFLLKKFTTRTHA